MKLVFFDDYRLGVLRDDGVVDVSGAVADLHRHSAQAHSAQALLNQVIAGWDGCRDAIASAAASGAARPVDQVTLRPPVPRPGQLVCLAGNYIEPDHPEKETFNAFLKSPTSVMTTGDTVELADADATVFHFEPEFALVMGKPAAKLAPEDALGRIFGYTQFMDVSARGLPGGFFLGKSWHTFGPMGPVLVTADEIPDPNALGMRLWVNDNLKHDVNTGEMARHVPELLAEVTAVVALEPGDVVSTGTHHYALSPIQDGDVVRMSIEGLGPDLSVDVTDPRKRTWDR